MSKSTDLSKIHTRFTDLKQRKKITLEDEHSVALEVLSAYEGDTKATFSYLVNALDFDEDTANAVLKAKPGQSSPTPARTPAPSGPRTFEVSAAFAERVRSAIAAGEQEGEKKVEGLTHEAAARAERRLAVGARFLDSKVSFDRMCGLILLRDTPDKLQSEDFQIIAQAKKDYAKRTLSTVDGVSNATFFDAMKAALISEGHVEAWLSGERTAWE